MRPIWLVALLALAVCAGVALWMYVSPGAAITFGVLSLVPFVPRAAFRFLSSIFVLVAILAFVADLTPAISAGGTFDATAFSDHWISLSPGSLQAARQAVSNSAAGPRLWDDVIALIIACPTFILFGALALAAGLAGRRKRQINIYAN